MNYLVLHGSFGSPFGNWFPYLRSELEKRELTVYTPDMPTGVGYQNYDNWSKVMDAYVSAGVVNENTIVFAHSIAPVFICKYLVEHNLRVKRLVLVTARDTERDSSTVPHQDLLRRVPRSSWAVFTCMVRALSRGSVRQPPRRPPRRE